MKMYIVYDLPKKGDDEFSRLRTLDKQEAIDFARIEQRRSCDKDYYYEIREYDLPDGVDYMTFDDYRSDNYDDEIASEVFCSYNTINFKEEEETEDDEDEDGEEEDEENEDEEMYVIDKKEMERQEKEFEKFQKAEEGRFNGFDFCEVFHEKIKKSDAIYVCEANDCADAVTPFGTFHAGEDGVTVYFFSKTPKKVVEFNRSVYFF